MVIVQERMLQAKPPLFSLQQRHTNILFLFIFILLRWLRYFLSILCHIISRASLNALSPHHCNSDSNWTLMNTDTSGLQAFNQPSANLQCSLYSLYTCGKLINGPLSTFSSKHSRLFSIPKISVNISLMGKLHWEISLSRRKIQG